ncbi:MAG TPA: hypothetical protein VF383_10435 [Candidatus Dormibacteraeota bacterium]
MSIWSVIKSIATFRHLRVLGFATGAVAIAAGAVWITASAAGVNVGFLGSSPASTPAGASTAAGVDLQMGTASAACNDFVSHFATDLGSTPSKVDAAFQKAIGQTLDDEVKNGDITQTQADAIKKKVAGQAPCALLPAAAGTMPAAQLGAYRQALLSAAASALSITDQQLTSDLSKGMTLSQIAAAQKPPVTEAQFRAGLIAKLTPLLDAAVAGKKLTSAQEQTIIHQLQTGPIPYWTTPMHPTKKPAAASPGPAV